MKAVEFPEVNLRIAENQPEYQTLPVHVQSDIESNGFFTQATICFELDKDELKQVAETGRIWISILIPTGSNFHPIGATCIKPEGCTDPQTKLNVTDHLEVLREDVYSNE